MQQKAIVAMSICSLMFLLAQVRHGVEAINSAKSEKGPDYDGEENEDVEHSKGQYQKTPFRANKKIVFDGAEGDRKIIAAAHDGAGGSYTLQIQVEVPLQTAYSPKRGGSGGYEDSSSGSSVDGKVSDDPFASLSWLSSPIQLKDFS